MLCNPYLIPSVSQFVSYVSIPCNQCKPAFMRWYYYLVASVSQLVSFVSISFLPNVLPAVHRNISKKKTSLISSKKSITWLLKGKLLSTFTWRYRIHRIPPLHSSLNLTRNINFNCRFAYFKFIIMWRTEVQFLLQLYFY